MAQQGIPLIEPVLRLILGARNERFVKRYTARVEAINAFEPQMRAMSDSDLRAKLGEFRGRVAGGTRVDDVMVEAFAVAREVMDRNVGIRNIFNPEHGFDPSVLSGEGRRLFDRVREQIAGLPDTLPKTLDAKHRKGEKPPSGEADEAGEFLGHAEPVGAWQHVDIPPALYEAVREAYPESRPPFRSRPFDVQLIGAMVLSQGKIAEMKTGEGKTIVAPLAAYLACIEHLRVHVVTVNDYLVQRDRDWTFPFFRGLGLTVGAIHPMHMQPEVMKREMYRCDVVYGTTSEFGFDFLRDNMKGSVESQVQRRREFAIVDEVDSILIDEARTPLIISGPAHDDQPRYEIADRLAKHLMDKQKPWMGVDEKVRRTLERIKGLEGDIRQTRDREAVPAMQAELKQLKADLPGLEGERDQHTQYFEVQMERKSCHLTHEGVTEAQRVAGIGSFYVDENMDVPHLLEQSLRAYAVYEKDRDYIVMPTPDPMTGRTEPSIVIVDTFTGRPMIGRQWSDGLHQAVEAKEQVPIKQETQTVATVTIQNFFKMYKRLAGMTGTADTEAQEFHDIYHLDVVSIPTNKAVIREDHDDLMFLREKDKWDAIVDEIKTFNDVGGPILVGTTSVDKSEKLSQMLTRKHAVQHEVLNAKQHEREAHIVENAGQLGAVMIATNMAGRGTDIKLGAVTRERLLDHWLKRGICPRTVTVESSEEQLREGVYRKVAPKELDIPKREAEEMPFEELELRLLRSWTLSHTWIGENKIESMDAEALREALDGTGRFLLHRIRWFRSIEDMGGLHVIGTERHESRRIDNQLRGRSGRQGDKGSSRFFVSLEDDLMKLFAGETTMKILSRLGMKEGDAIESGMLSKRIEGAQRKVEERNFQIRKNILEYDEVMEYQRQSFYGLRQRVLEGRRVKGLLREYIDAAINDACEEYLDPDYPAQCAAEYAKQRLDCSIMADRLRGRDLHEMERLIRREAKDDARGMIGVTLGEYMPIEGSEVKIDFDAVGLVNWAKGRFGVELNAADLRTGGAAERKHVEDMLYDAAAEKIEQADLSGLVEYLQDHYGAGELSSWFEQKFGVKVPTQDIVAAMEDEDDEEHTPQRVLMDKADELYEKREVEYPIDYVMESTMVVARQDPQQAFENLCTWAGVRFGLKLTPEQIKTTPPARIRERLLEASRAFVASGRLDEEIDHALAAGDTDDSLDAYLTERMGIGLPDWMRYLREEEREQAIRARVESLLRAEQLQLERTILLQTLDGEWKDHLYEMDQLRDGISFRAFSQQDPRIEYKREGSQKFTAMLQRVQDKVTDYVFKVRLSPARMAQSQGQPGGAPPPSRPRGAPAGQVTGSIAAPGMRMSSDLMYGTPTPKPKAEQDKAG